MAMIPALETSFPLCPAGFFSSGSEEDESPSLEPTGGHFGQNEGAFARPNASPSDNAVRRGIAVGELVLRVVRGTPRPDSMERWSRRSERLASWLLGEWQREQVGTSTNSPSGAAALGAGAGPPGRAVP